VETDATPGVECSAIVRLLTIDDNFLSAAPVAAASEGILVSGLETDTATRAGYPSLASWGNFLGRAIIVGHKWILNCLLAADRANGLNSVPSSALWRCTPTFTKEYLAFAHRTALLWNGFPAFPR
jgi:hypothetical protein